LSGCRALGILRAIPTPGAFVTHVRAVHRAAVSLIAFSLLAGTACRLEHYDVGDSGPPLFSSVDIISTPAAPGSAEPNLTVGAGRRVYLSWLEPTRDSSYAFRLAVREGNHWSAARTIVREKNLFVNWADFPSVVALPDGRLAAHWLQRSGPGRYSYGVRVSQSSDGGVTWSRPVTPHRARVETEHGFASLWPATAGRLGVIWLDGRKYRPTGQTAPNEMGLITTTIGPDNSLGPEAALDDRVCDCCQTAVAIAGGGPVAVYRDRTADEIRDIYVVRQVDGRWSTPKAVHNDGWRIAACPVNGPAIAADGDRVVVAWFTGAADTARVNVAFSDNAGNTFSLPTRVDDGSPAGRVDVALQADGSALVSWLERTALPGSQGGGGEGAEVRVRRVRSDGSLGQWSTVARSTVARASGFPQMVATERGEVYFAWTAPGNPSTVRVARAIVRRSPEGGA
jgi:hypothetical protein